MSDTVIKISSLSKQYRLGTVGAGTLRGDFQRWMSRLRGKEDPFLQLGKENTLDSSEGEYVWALKEINLEIKKGEILGIIGKNGAGKSTLLKILSRVTGPTSGLLKMKGRVASLLEVGTGFHPELTGMENIYLNGAILGMTKDEIRYKLDEIIDFSGVRKYINTPVKRYSSGMRVRLGFAIAAFLEPEILIVDEVLAVGDAEFQKKAIGKMQDVSKGDGRTVLFVSHNMVSIQNLCTRCILLEEGKIRFDDEPRRTITKYLENEKSQNNLYYENLVSDKDLYISKLELLNSKNKQTNKVLLGETISFITYYTSKKENQYCNLYIGIYNQNDEKLLHLGSPYGQLDGFIAKENGMIICKINKISLAAGKYYVNLSLHLDNKPYDHVVRALTFSVENTDFYNTGKIPDHREIKFHIEQEWREKLND